MQIKNRRLILTVYRTFSSKPKQRFGDLASQQASNDNLPEFLRNENQKLDEIDFGDVKGLDDFKKAIQYQHEKNYSEAEYHLKEGLKTLKQTGSEKSMGYVYMLRRLAYIAFLSQKYTESERYFSVVAKVVP